MKLKTAKIQFDDESRYNDIKPIRVHHDQVDKAVDQLVSLVNMIKNKLGKYFFILIIIYHKLYCWKENSRLKSISKIVFNYHIFLVNEYS